MSLETPPELVEAIGAELAASGASFRRQSLALEELFHLFVHERSRVKSLSYLDIPKLRNAYLRYHVPLNAARATRVLDQVLALQPAAAELDDVVDLGAGLGSASLACLFRLPASRARRYALFDRSRAAMKMARRLLERSAAGLAKSGQPAALACVKTQVSLLPALPPLPRRSLVWLSMVLNEIGVGLPRGPEPESILARLQAKLEPPSIVIVIEPALRLPGRNLLRFHDAALRAGGWRVIAPCTHQRVCPLLRAAGNSWCHFHFRWNAPRLVREIAEPLGLDCDAPSLAFLALERSAQVPPATPERARVIGDPMPLRSGKLGIYLCQAGERRLVGVPAGKIRRGDIVRAGKGAEDLEIEVTWETSR